MSAGNSAHDAQGNGSDLDPMTPTQAEYLKALGQPEQGSGMRRSVSRDQSR